jgi:hypothetical protein
LDNFSHRDGADELSMSALISNVLVGLALLVSIGYAAISLGPKSLRKRLLAASAKGLAAAPTFLRLGRAARKLAAASDAKAQGACGGCDTCGDEQPAASPASSGEIKVPIAKIGRRLTP